MSNELHEEMATVARVPPQNIAASAATAASDAVDMAQFNRVLFVMDLAYSAVDTTTGKLKIQHATSTADGDFQDFATTVESATHATPTDSGSSKQVLIEVSQRDMPLDSRYVRAVVTITGAASDSTANVSVAGLGDVSRYKPGGSQKDLSSVAEIVVAREVLK